MIGDPPAKQLYITIPGVAKSCERAAPPFDEIFFEHSLFWGEFISINRNCQEKLATENRGPKAPGPPQNPPPIDFLFTVFT